MKTKTIKTRTLVQFYNQYNDCTEYRMLPPDVTIEEFQSILNESNEYDLILVDSDLIEVSEDDY